MSHPQRRILLFLALSLFFGGLAAIAPRVSGISQEVGSTGAVTSRAALGSDPAATIIPGGTFEPPMLILELPNSEAEVKRMAVPGARPLWREAILWDSVFIVGYVLLFVAIPFGARDVAVWGILAGVADVVENAAMWAVLADVAAASDLGGRLEFIVLPLAGAAKWILFFLACRALGVNLARYQKWRVPAIALFACVAAGIWATLLARAGLPARPILGLVSRMTAVILVGVAVRRMLVEDPGPEVVNAETDRKGIVATAA